MSNENDKIKDLGIEVPEWIEQDITVSQVEGVVVSGCAGGSYMPAVTYHEAIKIMSKHGDAVMEYIDEAVGLNTVKTTEVYTWGGLATNFLSIAVELWCAEIRQDAYNQN